MKAYRYTGHPDHGGELQVCDVPDGALLLEIGSRLNPSGGPDLQPISWISRATRQYSRGDGAQHQFPEKTVAFTDLVWRPGSRLG